MKTIGKKLIIGLMASILFMIPAASVLAGAGPEPKPDDAVVSDTKVWGVITLYCPTSGDDLATVRVKRVVDCNVETELWVDIDWGAGCPSLANIDDLIDWSLDNYNFFTIPGTPYINKVKNSVQVIDGGNNNTTSVEAQFGFWTPAP